MKRLVALGLACAVLAFGAGCSRDELKPGEARLTVSGDVLLGEAGKALAPVRGSRTIHDGDRVKVVSGSAQIATAAGPVYELHEADFRLGRSPRLDDGEVLVRSAPGKVAVQAAGSRVVVRGVARVERSLAVSAGVYVGRAVLESGGREFELAALRQAAVPAIGVLPTSATPLVYDDGDDWDRRFLGAAMAFGRELEARSRALEPNVAPGEGRTPGFYRVVLPELERERAFDGALLSPGRPVGETLVGATLAVSGRKGSFTERWRDVFGFRDEGAAWGLVALEQEVASAPDPVLRRLDAALGRAPLRFAAGPAIVFGPTVSSDSGSGELGRGDRTDDDDSDDDDSNGGSGGGGRTTTTTRPTTTTTSTTSTTTTTLLRTPDTGPLNPVTEPILDPVVDTIGGLLDP